jgi:hypothetical protein
MELQRDKEEIVRGALERLIESPLDIEASGCIAVELSGVCSREQINTLLDLFREKKPEVVMEFRMGQSVRSIINRHCAPQ